MSESPKLDILARRPAFTIVHVNNFRRMYARVHVWMKRHPKILIRKWGTYTWVVHNDFLHLPIAKLWLRKYTKPPRCQIEYYLVEMPVYDWHLE